MFTDADTLDILLRGLLLSGAGLIWIIVAVRLVGLRAFSKMTASNFVVTIAIGSLLAGAGQASDWSGFMQCLFAIAALLAVQYIIAIWRQNSDSVKEALHNTPVVLMRDGVINDAAMRRTRTTRSDLIAKLREANVLHINDVRAVVLETTGDISVLHGDTLDTDLLYGVEAR